MPAIPCDPMTPLIDRARRNADLPLRIPDPAVVTRAISEYIGVSALLTVLIAPASWWRRLRERECCAIN